MYRTGYKPYENTDKNLNKTLKRFNRYILVNSLLNLYYLYRSRQRERKFTEDDTSAHSTLQPITQRWARNTFNIYIGESLSINYSVPKKETNKVSPYRTHWVHPKGVREGGIPSSYVTHYLSASKRAKTQMRSRGGAR